MAIILFFWGWENVYGIKEKGTVSSEEANKWMPFNVETWDIN